MSYEFNANWAKTFLELSKSQSLYETANKLGVSTTAVSKQITKLEERLGHELRNRSLKQMNLTTFGVSYKDRVEKIVAEIDKLALWVEQYDGESGEVLIATHDRNILKLSMYPYLEEFYRQYPDICLTIKEIPPTFRYDDFSADVYWGVGEYFGDRRTILVERDLVRFTYGIFAPYSYLKNNKTPLTLDDLAEHTMIASDHVAPVDHIMVSDPSTTTGIRGIRVKRAITVNGPVTDLADQGLGLFNSPVELPVIQNLVRNKVIVPVLEEHWKHGMEAKVYYDSSSRNNELSQKVIQFFLSKRDLWQRSLFN